MIVLNFVVLSPTSDEKSENQRDRIDFRGLQDRQLARNEGDLRASRE